MLEQSLLDRLIENQKPGSLALGLTGSHARGTATSMSDIDLYRFVEVEPEQKYTLFLFEDHLVSLTTTTFAAKRADLLHPDPAFFAVPGIRQMKILWDPEGQLAALQRLAQAFRWESIQPAVDQYVSENLMGLAEEVHKILGAIKRQDESAVLYGAYGLVLVLARVVAVARHLLIESENRFFADVMAAGGSGWSRVFRLASGFDRLSGAQPDVQARAVAALDLYVQTVRMFLPAVRSEHLPVVKRTLQDISMSIS